jgi:hypothetical protein
MNDLPLAGLGHNRPPAQIEAAVVIDKSALDIARERKDLEVASANEWSAQYQAIEDEFVASEANQKLAQLDAVWNEIEAIRKAEYKVHDDKLKAVQRDFKPLLEDVAACRLVIHRLHQGWLAFDQKRIDDDRAERERIAAEKRRLAELAAEQANASGPNAATRIIQAREAEAEAEQAHEAFAAAPTRAQTRGTLGGRTRSLRTVWLANVVSIEKAFEHYKARKEVKELLNRLANADARAGIKAIPGCYVWSEEN